MFHSPSHGPTWVFPSDRVDELLGARSTEGESAPGSRSSRIDSLHGTHDGRRLSRSVRFPRRRGCSTLASRNSMKLSGIDANLLATLDALLQEKSVTRAAKRLGVGQPAVSHSLARLREHFRDPLLVLTGRTYVLTPRAQQ